MPEVLEYVKQKAMANQLRKELGNYERKVTPLAESANPWRICLTIWSYQYVEAGLFVAAKSTHLYHEPQRIDLRVGRQPD